MRRAETLPALAAVKASSCGAPDDGLFMMVCSLNEVATVCRIGDYDGLEEPLRLVAAHRPLFPAYYPPQYAILRSSSIPYRDACRAISRRGGDSRSRSARHAGSSAFR